ncbi:MAG: type II secretion system protein [Clostridium sp.]
MKKKGNSLIEVIIALGIITAALLFLGVGLNSFLSIAKEERNMESVENILEIIEKELKYETTICELNKKIKENESLYFDSNASFQEEILNKKILEIGSDEINDIEVKKEGELKTGLKLKIVYKKGGYEKSFEKEKWMEK